MLQTILQFSRDQSAATAIEYGLVAALVSVAIFASLAQVGVAVQELYLGTAELIEQITGN